MPLLTTTEEASLAIAASAQHIAGFVSAACHHANQMTRQTLALGNEDLEGWLNAKPLEQRMAEFAGHGLLGEALNAAAAVVESNLGMASGSIARVDVRSVADKLADQFRAMQPDPETGRLMIIDLPRPEPEPEPQPEA